MYDINIFLKSKDFIIYLVLTFAVGVHYCSHWYLDRRFMIIITSIVLIFPLCFSKTIKFLQIPR